MAGDIEEIRVLYVDDESGFVDTVATFLERVDDRITVETATAWSTPAIRRPRTESGSVSISSRISRASMVEAVAFTESDSGGARCEMTGVEVAK